MVEVNLRKIGAQNTVQTFSKPANPHFSPFSRAVSKLRAVSALMASSALLAASDCLLRLTDETCAIVIVAKAAVVFNFIIASPPNKIKWGIKP